MKLARAISRVTISFSQKENAITDFYYKVRWNYYMYKLRQRCYKLRQLFYYQVRHGLSQITTGVTTCDDYYKLRQYNQLPYRSYIKVFTQT